MHRVLRRLLGRLGASAVVLVGVSMLIFVIARVFPGDPARIALGANASAEAVAMLRAQLHLDENIAAQYGHFVAGIARGDLGISLYTNRPVMTDVAQFLPATLELVAVAAILTIGLGVPIGVLGARFSGTWVDNLLRVLSLLAVSAPSFVVAIVLMLTLAYLVPLFPIAGRISDDLAIPPITNFLLVDCLVAGNFAALGDALRHIMLPAFALAFTGIGQAARLTRASMLETYKRPFIEMARAYGFPERRIAWRYALKPSLIPSFTLIGLDVASMLGSAFLVEAVFAWPGFSRYGVQVILRKDLNAIVGTVLVIAVLFIVINVLVDVLVSMINPRIRHSAASK